MTPIALLSLTALTIGVGIIISLGLAKAITAYQERKEETQARAAREANWIAARSARWTAY